mmetsp:Transcript_41447/g.128875  ORF Transcript_41447/g.128875 Transcript_41447/m.128875 type:complete len:390 (+) Transcript_41447:54-1223(+)
MEAAPRCPLVVGGSGQLGALLVPRLARAPGCERVLVLDVRPPAPRTLAAAAPGKVDFIQHRLGHDDIEEVASALAAADCIFSILSPPLDRAAERDFYATNVHGLRALAEASARAGVPRFVHLSSVAVTNMEISCSGLSEEDPLPPMSSYRSAYDVTKRLGEEVVLSCDGLRALRTCVLRPSGICLSPHDYMLGNLLGYSLPGVIFVPRHCAQVDMIDGGDLCRAMLLAARALDERPAEVAGQVFNVTRGEALSARELAELAAEVLGWHVVFIPPLAHGWLLAAFGLLHRARQALGLRLLGCPTHVFWSYHLYQKTFDNSKARRCLRFTSECSLRVSVERALVDYAEQRRSASRRLFLRACTCLGCAVSALLSMSLVSWHRYLPAVPAKR